MTIADCLGRREETRGGAGEEWGPMEKNLEFAGGNHVRMKLNLGIM